ncbi:MAG: hypothetical protein M3P48_01385, partial [Actinomycetota bacterium]|nr:hypothetical protein [Actinomycetota bacterium]
AVPTVAVALLTAAAWAASRVVGFAPWGGERAASDTTGLAVVALELVCAAGVAVALVVRREAPGLGRIPLVALAAGALAMSAVATPAMASAQSGAGHSPSVAGHHH